MTTSLKLRSEIEHEYVILRNEKYGHNTHTHTNTNMGKHTNTQIKTMKTLNIDLIKLSNIIM